MPGPPLGILARLTQPIEAMEPAAFSVGGRDKEGPSFAVCKRRAQHLGPERAFDEVGLVDDETVKAFAAEVLRTVGALQPELTTPGEEEDAVSFIGGGPRYLADEGLKDAPGDARGLIDRRYPPVAAALDRSAQRLPRTQPRLPPSSSTHDHLKAVRTIGYRPLQGVKLRGTDLDLVLGGRRRSRGRCCYLFCCEL